MTIGTKFLQRLNEAKAGEDKDSIKDGFNIPLDTQQKALASRLKRPIEKKLVALHAMAGVPGRYLNTKDIEDRIASAADELRGQLTIRRQFDKFYSALATIKGHAIAPAAVAEAKGDQKRGGFVQKLMETVLVRLGLPEELITTGGPGAVGAALLKTAKIIEQDSNLEQILRQLAVKMGIEANDALAEGEKLKEAIDVGTDDFASAIVGLIADLGIPDQVLQMRRAQIVKALREKKMNQTNRAEVLRKIQILRDAIAKGVRKDNQPAAPTEE